MKYLFPILILLAFFSSCVEEEGECIFNQYTGTGNCPEGNSPVNSQGCCPDETPYFCSADLSCYAFCDYATSECATTVVKANLGGSTGGNTGGSGCDYSLSGTWTRVSSANDCENIRISMSGSSGIVSSSVNGCCYGSGESIWTSYDPSSCTIDVMIKNRNDCEFIRYEQRTIYWNGPNEIQLGTITYRK